MKLDDEIVELKEWDAVRVPPGTWRGYEAGPRASDPRHPPNLGEDPRKTHGSATGGLTRDGPSAGPVFGNVNGGREGGSWDKQGPALKGGVLMRRKREEWVVVARQLCGVRAFGRASRAIDFVSDGGVAAGRRIANRERGGHVEQLGAWRSMGTAVADGIPVKKHLLPLDRAAWRSFARSQTVGASGSAMFSTALGSSRDFDESRDVRCRGRVVNTRAPIREEAGRPSSSRLTNTHSRGRVAHAVNLRRRTDTGSPLSSSTCSPRVVRAVPSRECSPRRSAQPCVSDRSSGRNWSSVVPALRRRRLSRSSPS